MINTLDYDLSPFIVKFNSVGNIIEIKNFHKDDTTSVLQFGFQKDDGNYLFMGTMSDSITPDKRNYTYLCETDQELQILKENYYAISEPFHSYTIENYLVTPDQN